MSRLTPFEFRLFRKLEPLKLKGSRVLVACSGGMDSVALTYLLSRLSSRLKLELEVACVHHGESVEQELMRFRDQAVETVRELAEGLALPFHVRRRVPEDSGELVSEAELREFRHHALKELAKDRSCQWIAFAHHSDDLLETRLMRLARGTGAQGIEAMNLTGKNGILRPFLGESRDEIEAYARENGLKWIDDPSNRSTKPFRNWLRLKWLPLLERKRAGSVRNLAASLERLAQAVSRGKREIPLLEATLDRTAFCELGIAEQRASLAALLLSLGAKDFTSAHIDEILKRFRSQKVRQTFTVLGLDWCCNARQIEVRRAAKNEK